MGWTYTDRFGVKHYTIEGINYLAQQAMNAFGYVILTGKHSPPARPSITRMKSC
jgi:hypothetical protein